MITIYGVTKITYLLLVPILINLVVYQCKEALNTEEWVHKIIMKISKIVYSPAQTLWITQETLITSTHKIVTNQILLLKTQQNSIAGGLLQWWIRLYLIVLSMRNHFFYKDVQVSQTMKRWYAKKKIN